MRLVKKKGAAWEVPGRGGFYLDEKNHLTGYLPDEGATHLSLSTESALIEGLAAFHVGIRRRERVHVVFSREEVRV